MRIYTLAGLTLLMIVLVYSVYPQQKRSRDKARTSDKEYKAQSCIYNYVDNPCDLLDESLIKKYSGDKQLKKKNPNDPKKVGSKSMKKFMIAECSYSWDSGQMRKFSIGNKEVETPLHFYINVGSIKVVKNDNPLEYFKKTYRNLTEEEKKKLDEEINKGLDRQVQKGKIKEKDKDLARTMTGLAGSFLYEEVGGVGDAASWNKPRNIKNTTASAGSLIVLHKNVQFNVSVEIGGTDDSLSKAAAIEVAKAIIAKCK